MKLIALILILTSFSVMANEDGYDTGSFSQPESSEVPDAQDYQDTPSITEHRDPASEEEAPAAPENVENDIPQTFE